jgi:hypothetical protein
LTGSAHADGLRHIVITSIQRPTNQVQAFLRQPGWRTLFVADQKTPDFDTPEPLECLSAKSQQQCPWSIANLLPWNHYARKNLGYLKAVQNNAPFIFDTDDDNAPIEPWTPQPTSPGIVEAAGAPKWVNVYAHFGARQAWPRGFPLEYIGHCVAPATGHRDTGEVVVWQGMVEGDADVDAIYRLTRPEPVEFRPAPPLVLAAGSYCPFNSQNTLWSREAFPYLYLPATVTFRFTDILRGLVAQRCFWAHGWRLGFQQVTARQARNPHNLLADFRDEIPCYLEVSRVAGILDGLELDRDAADNLRQCYRALAAGDIVAPGELPLVDSWLEALASGPSQWVLQA